MPRAPQPGDRHRGGRCAVKPVAQHDLPCGQEGWRPRWGQAEGAGLAAGPRWVPGIRVAGQKVALRILPWRGPLQPGRKSGGNLAVGRRCLARGTWKGSRAPSRTGPSCGLGVSGGRAQGASRCLIVPLKDFCPILCRVKVPNVESPRFILGSQSK